MAEIIEVDFERAQINKQDMEPSVVSFLRDITGATYEVCASGTTITEAVTVLWNDKGYLVGVLHNSQKKEILRALYSAISYLENNDD